jgi:uncharacterized membrane protein YtjA (UPF0391 family)
VVDYAGLRRPEGWLFLIVSLIAGTLGLMNVSQMTKCVSTVLFAMFFLVFLALMGFAYLVSEAIETPPLPRLMTASA